MDKKIIREIKFLRFYSFALTLAIFVLFYLSLNPSSTKKFEEISVERMNVLEKNGDLKMVVSNSERQHNGSINGREFPERERPAGIIFFNSAGDECGGLIYDGNKKNAGLVLSVDKFRDDQIMQLQYMENTRTKTRKYGVQLWDYPKENAFDERYDRYSNLKTIENPEERQKAVQQMKKDSLLAKDRLFLGKNFNKEVGLFIRDQKGKPRIRIYIDGQDNPRLEFYDEKGEIVQP